MAISNFADASPVLDREEVDPQDKAKESRITIRLSPSARKAVEEIMERADISTIQDAVRRAIGDSLFLLRERNGGAKVLLQTGKKFREIQWP